MTHLTTATLLALTLAQPLLAQSEPTQPAFDPALFATSQPNAYFPLTLGHTITLSGTRVVDGEPDPETAESAVITVMGAGPVILDVQTTVILDEAFEAGLIVERTFDYYAADQDGNIWYMGEDVTNFRYDDAGNFTGTDTASAWRAGVNGALPGIAMLAQPVVGQAIMQEIAPVEEAMDYAAYLAIDATVTGPAGTFTDVIQTFEGSTIDPDAREIKYWAAGIGLIRADEELSEALDNPGIVIELQP